MKKNWVFGVTDFIGNPKWMYLYLKENHPEITITWIADSEEKAKAIKLSYPTVNVYSRDSLKGKKALSNAQVYVEEQFREFYPEELSDECVYLNLWHGVGLKNIERKAPFNGIMANNLMKKNIQYFDNYYYKTMFLVTSKDMEDHFASNITTPKSNFIQGDYPRNIVPKILNTEKSLLRKEALLKSANRVIMFAPTFRDARPDGTFSSLLPNFERISQLLEKSNGMMIVNLHPRMRDKADYLKIYNDYKNNDNFLFIENTDDIYEYFKYIDYTIVDYSSIFYDLMASGADKFIRYIPDIEEYTTYQPNMVNYEEQTYGPIVKDFDELINLMEKDEQDSFKDNDKYLNLMNYFYGYSSFDETNLEKMIQQVNQFVPATSDGLRELHSFDIFDTLLDRNTTRPAGIFYKIQEMIRDNMTLDFPKIFKKDYIKVRNQGENAARFNKRRTQVERNSDIIEVTLDEIFEQISFLYNLSEEQCNWLKKIEIETEIASVRPIQHRIDLMHQLANEGHKVMMISDMYLPRDVIGKMVAQADPKLLEYDLFLSSETGYQKSTGLLYQYVFFNNQEKFKKWVHYGDNKHADETVPDRYCIETVHHELENFSTYENRLVTFAKSYDGYRVANLMRDFRVRNNIENTVGNYTKEIKTTYYAYAYVGLYLVPYVYWTLSHALKNGRKTIYFITRDGNLLKPIADTIIKETGWDLETKLIYGSRKSWRIPGIDFDENGNISETVYSAFGLFQTEFESFDKLLQTAELTETQFSKFFPSLQEFKTMAPISLEDITNFRNIARDNKEYNEHLLKVSHEKLDLVAKYMKQEIDPNEPITAVEFWGRGYTQNSFKNILRRTFEDETLGSEFYYARSIYQSEEGSIRYNLTNSVKDLTFIEFLFNIVPMKTVTGYEEKDGEIVAIFEEQFSDFHEYFEKYTLEFASDFASLDLYDADTVIADLFDFGTDYFTKYKKDPMILANFSQFNDNAAIGGSDIGYAPAFTPSQLLTKKISTLQTMTKSLPMSLERSSKATNQIFKLRQDSSRFIRKIIGKK